METDMPRTVKVIQLRFRCMFVSHFGALSSQRFKIHLNMEVAQRVSVSYRTALLCMRFSVHHNDLFFTALDRYERVSN